MNLMSTQAITRFAPSPTGSLHLGNARTAFFSYLWARKTGGRFILRIEDTDVERSQDRYREGLLTDLRWLGLMWDEGPDLGGPSGPYSQAERGEIYREQFARLEHLQLVYPCYCSPEELELSRKLQRMAGKPPRYAGTCRDLNASQKAKQGAAGRRPTLRFKVPTGAVIEFIDTVHGPQRFLSDDIGDFIIRRDNGSAAFFFCNAIDDALMGVTQVLRGDDHLTNTPRQLLVLDALGLRRPNYGHVGLLIGADGSPLSKRHGSTSAQEFRERGFLPEAVLNHLFHLGHASDVERWLALGEMPQHFRAEHLGRAPARFDEAQLVHWQKEAIARLSADAAHSWLAAAVPADIAPPGAAAFVELVRHNVVLPQDALVWRQIVFGELPPLDAGAEAMLRSAGQDYFLAAVEAFDRNGGELSAITQAIKERTGRKGADLYRPLRLALTGQAQGPELAPILRLIPAAVARRRLALWSGA
jgi:glutamyl-tRNA synthetase